MIPDPARAQTVEQIEKALKRIGYIINDAPYRGEERDGAWQAFLENKKEIDALITALRVAREQTEDEKALARSDTTRAKLAVLTYATTTEKGSDR